MGRVILFGLTEMSEMMHFYLTHDSDHEVAAFTVDEEYLNHESFCGLPVLPFKTIESAYPPDEFEMGVMLGFKDVNRLRATKYAEAKAKGYKMLTYVSSKAIIWPGASIGENSYIFEQSVIMPFSRIGNNVVVSINSLVGHHSIISDHTFLSAHSVVLGCVTVGAYCILGANSTIKDFITVGESCVIGVGTVITKNTKDGQVYVSDSPKLLKWSSDELKDWITWPKNGKKMKPVSNWKSQCGDL